MHGHGGEVVFATGLLVVGEQVEDLLERAVADGRVEVAGEAVMAGLDRGVDGVDDALGHPFGGLEDVGVGQPVLVVLAEHLLQFLQDQVQGDGHPVLLVEMDGPGGESQGLEQGHDAGAEHAPLVGLDDHRAGVVQLVGRLDHPGRGVGQTVVEQEFRHEIVEPVRDLELHPRAPGSGSGALPRTAGRAPRWSAAGRAISGRAVGRGWGSPPVPSGWPGRSGPPWSRRSGKNSLPGRAD